MPEEKKTKAKAQPKPKKVVKTATAKTAVFMRKEPTTDAPYLRVIPANHTCYVSKVEDEWIELTYNGATGWSMKEYFTLNYEE